VILYERDGLSIDARICLRSSYMQFK